MDVPPELNCPLCLDLSEEPVTTPCAHNFCRQCILRARGSGHNGCPFCRRPLGDFDPEAAEINADMAALIIASVPQETLDRRRSQMPRTLEVVVINLYEDVPQKIKNCNKWIMLVALRGMANQHASTLIEKVVYELHPTFSPSTITAYPPYFSLCRFGWGTFTVRCQIHWNSQLKMPPMVVDHHLVFESDGGRTTQTVDLDPQAFDALGFEAQGGAPESRSNTFRRSPARGPRRHSSRRSEQQASQPLEVVVGNRCKALPDEKYEWTMYVMLPGFQRQKAWMIDRVLYKLHPMFTPDTHEVSLRLRTNLLWLGDI